MSFGGMNYAAVLLAAVASFLFGGVWHGAFSRRALARTAEGERRKSQLRTQQFRVDAVPFIIAFVALLVMAYVLAGVVGNLGAGQVTLRNGVISALFVWAGFVMTSLVVNHTVEGVGGIATLMDAGHWLGVLVIQGAVIGWLGA